MSGMGLHELDQEGYRQIVRIRRRLEYAVEAADLVRRDRRLWLDDYHDGELHALDNVLAYIDGYEATYETDRDGRRAEEQAASLGRRVLVALCNEADELHLTRFYAVTRRARHAQTRARLRLSVDASEPFAYSLQEVAS
jgi:hypothetical protein